MEADVAVAGAGPAGSTIANRLARLGYRVHIFEAMAFPRPHIGESLPASVLPFFDELGVRDEIEEAGFLRPRGAIVRWAGETHHRLDHARGFQVDRGRLDAILLRAAVRQGAVISQPARVKCIHHIGEQEWWLSFENGLNNLRSKFRFIVDATGRKGCLPGRNRKALQPPTLAMYAYWDQVPFKNPETLIEATGDQWYWAAPLPDGTANATVFVEDSRVIQTTPGELKDLYLSLIRSSRLLSPFLKGRVANKVQACPAGASCVENPVGDDWLKIGDAAMTYDPLSSQGVQNAIVSGLQGAAIVNTLLGYPDARSAAKKFCRDRLQENASRHIRTLAGFYGQQAVVTPSLFWKSRSQAGEQITPPSGQHSVELSPNTWIGLNPEATWGPTPVLLNDQISLSSGLQLRSQRPVVWLDGIPLENLLRWSFEQRRVVELLDDWTTCFGQERSGRILNWLIERQILVPLLPDS